MNKPCQNCKTDFEITPDDEAFYQKIDVPPPTFCPMCRLERRLAFLNTFRLYKRDCDLCKKSVVSRYPPDAKYVVYCAKCWWSDNWSPYDYGRDYDFSRPFFEQFNELLHEAPLSALSTDIASIATSPYTNHVGNQKNSYLIFHSDRDENCAYGFHHFDNKEVFDCSITSDSELCFDSIHSFQDNKCIGVDHTTESMECLFTRDAVGCQNCFASANIKNKKYVFFNEQLSKEEYFRKLSEIDLGSYSQYIAVKKQAEENNKKYPYKGLYDRFCVNSTGNYIFNSKNVMEGFETSFSQDSKFLFLVNDNPSSESYDISSWGNNMSRSYDSVNVGENISGIKFCWESGLGQSDAEYSRLSNGGKNHFGCVSVNKGEYCILNKRYSEDEFNSLREKIIKHMDEMPYTDKKGNIYKYGEFFPMELSDVPYNDSFGSLFFPKTREQSENEGLRWIDRPQKEHEITKNFDELPDNIKDADESILNEVIKCSACGNGFRIIGMEFQFLKRMNLPLPRECPMCRIMKKVNRWIENINYCKTIERECSKCGVSFRTTFLEKNAPIIYCKECYQAEVA